MQTQHADHLYIDASLLLHNEVYSVKMDELRQGGAAKLCLNLVSKISQYIRYYTPKRTYFCLDPAEGSWRKQIDTNYKAQRAEKLAKATPEDQWKKQVVDEAIQQLMPQLLDLLAVPAFIAPYIEADDWVAACVLNNPTVSGVMITSDHDYYQLINPVCMLLDPRYQYRVVMGQDGNLWKVKSDGSQETLGMTPQQHLLQKSIMGDNSDNLPGLIGIGEVKAKKAIQGGTVRQLIAENTGMITPRKSSKNPNPVPVHQDAAKVMQHNVRMMGLTQNEVIDKVKTLAAQKEAAGIREQRNNYSRLVMWLESKGYANEELARHLVSIFTTQWTA